MEVPDKVVRSTRSFKRISGAFKKGKKKEAEKISAADAGDADSVAGIDVDARSVASQVSVGGMEPNMMKFVLLLLDPSSRRFELLQLEFDANKGTVRNILSHIHLAASDDNLRKQKYNAMCDDSGNKRDENSMLSDFCSHGDVLVAVPENIAVDKVHKKAKSILRDKKVLKMLDSSGIDVKKWQKTEKKKSSAAKAAAAESASKSSSAMTADKPPPPPTGPPPGEKSKSAGTTGEEAGESSNAAAHTNVKMLSLILLLMDPETRRFELLQLEFNAETATVRDVLSQIPYAVNEEKFRTQVYSGIVDSNATVKEGDTLLSSFCKGKDVLVATPWNVSADTCAKLARPIIHDSKVSSMLRASGADPDVWRAENSKSLSSSASLMTFGKEQVFYFILALWVAMFTQGCHMYRSSPLESGQVLAPGSIMNKCGVLPTFATGCSGDAYLHMGKNGMLRFYNADRDLIWSMQGGLCHTKTCVDGLEIKADGNLVIGGKKVDSIFAKNNENVDLAPWPFVTQPKGLKRKRLNLQRNR